MAGVKGNRSEENELIRIDRKTTGKKKMKKRREIK